jgi:hypothetical protein
MEEINKNIIEVSNIYPNNIVAYNLQAGQRRLISYLRSKAYSICRTQIPYEYIKSAFNKFKNGLVYYSDKKPIAFCIWKISEYLRFSGTFRKLYIYLICGRQLDYKLVSRIFDDIVFICRKSNVQYITLQPANDILKSYYIECGFTETFESNTNSIILELDVNKSRMSLPRYSSRITHKTRKQRRHTVLHNSNNSNI